MVVVTHDQSMPDGFATARYSPWCGTALMGASMLLPKPQIDSSRPFTVLPQLAAAAPTWLSFNAAPNTWG